MIVGLSLCWSRIIWSAPISTASDLLKCRFTCVLAADTISALLASLYATSFVSSTEMLVGYAEIILASPIRGLEDLILSLAHLGM